VEAFILKNRSSMQNTGVVNAVAARHSQLHSAS
jgi:hypothetical protein